MEHGNDRTIFEYLKPTDNDMLSKLNSSDLKEILMYLDRYYLEYRDNLGLTTRDTFGIEIEIEHFIGWKKMDFYKFQLQLNQIIGNDKWVSKNDISLFQGREIASSILTDIIKNWENIKNVCEFANKNGRIDFNCSSHVHVGAQILGENSLYWYRFFRLWSVYENVIYRFCYGEYLTHRPYILKYAKPAALFYEDRLSLLDSKCDYSLIEMLRIIEPKNVLKQNTKKFGVSYWRMLADDNYELYENFNEINDGCTLEFRTPNPTLNEIVWQNLINFFIKLMLYCKRDKFDDDILNSRRMEVCGIFSNLWEYSKIYLEEVLELCDLIFDNNLDKIYFLRQYLKSFEVADKPFVKARKFTI